MVLRPRRRLWVPPYMRGRPQAWSINYDPNLPHPGGGSQNSLLTPGAGSLAISGIAPSASVVSPGAFVLLEDWSSRRTNGDGNQLFDAYLGEDPNQTDDIVDGSLRLVASGGDAIYMHHQTRGSSGYNWPGGYAQAWAKDGTFDSECNRLAVMVRSSVSVSRRSDGGGTIEIGTYIRSHGASDPTAQGSHYYHIYDPVVTADRWMKFYVTGKPQHQVGMSAGTEWPNQTDYMDKLTRWYYDTQASGFNNSTCDFGRIGWFPKAVDEPESEVASMVAYYTGTQYHLSWAGAKNTSKTYELRYHTSSMKTSGWDAGTSGGTTSNPNNDYTGCIWLLTASEVANMYMAVRVQGETDFTEVHIPQSMSGTNMGVA